jgi:hypothetical protein
MENEFLEEFYLELVPILKELSGGSVAYKPMYPNFPRQVTDASEAELFINAIIHYWTFGALLPQYEKLERLPLLDKTKTKVIGVGSDEEFASIFTSLMGAKTSLSETDRDDLQFFFANRSDFRKYLPAEIPLKENAALIGKLLFENYPLASANDLKPYFKTATDALRLITVMSCRDASLAQNSVFRSFRRRERRLILDLLEGYGNIEEDMLRYKNRWIRVGERLHPSEYDGYASLNAAFRKLRNNVKIETFGGKAASSITSKQYGEALSLLKTRPGELARKLDYLLRISQDESAVIGAFEDSAQKVSTPVLLQVREHFKHRVQAQSDIRVFFPKGNVAKAQCIKNELPVIDGKYCGEIVRICDNATQARDILLPVLSFSAQPFSDLPECFADWMERENPGTGEIYEPKTERNKFDLTENTQICIPIIIDLFERSVSWCDIGVTRNQNWYNNIEGNQRGIVLSCRAMTELVKPNLYDLVSLHIKARGNQCWEKENANIIFDVDDGITPFDTELFMSEYL